MQIQGKIVDIYNARIYNGEITVENGKIKAINEISKTCAHYIMPGFVDAHIHIESSMLVPSEFAKLAVVHGTVATVSDPHEIANVLGVEGVHFMIDNVKKTPFKCFFGAPSCVPATTFETAGATIDSKAIETLLKHPDIHYLAEMMNYPGVIYDDPEVLKKIALAKQYNKPVDGHAPGVIGDDLTKYINAGIYTDHECVTFNEAQEKLEKGMKILIREGSAAKNFEALIGLLSEYYKNIMFCSDDKHPDDLLLGHINTLCARAVAKGYSVFKVLQAACINPVKHYNLNVGTLRVGDAADFILVEDLEQFKTLKTIINGKVVFKNNTHYIPEITFETPNIFKTTLNKITDFKVPVTGSKIRVIEALEGQLVTKALIVDALVKNDEIVQNVEQDILKIAVVNRYNNEMPAVAFIKNFGLKNGAIASSVAHDSHNIIVVGVDDASICEAVNLLINNKGGIAVVSAFETAVLPLPVAGIMSNKNGEYVAKYYSKLNAITKIMGCTLQAPFMTLSFMALLVIPSLKLSDKGLFDGDTFQFTAVNMNS